jgi:hypothetical protein
MKTNQPSKRIFTTKVIVLFCVLVMNLMTSVAVNARTITVTSVTALQTEINKPETTAGDVFILANGTYLNNTLTISKSNITVKAATLGGVFLNGSNAITISGSYVTFSGFQFTSGDIGIDTVIEVTGSYNLITQLNFSNYFASKYIRIKDGSQYNEISYCNLEKKPAAAAIGCTIQISTSPTVPGYHKIRYCSFQNYFGLGGDYGNEPIRIGLSTENANKSKAIVEYCYFNNTGLGDSESVSIKCQENTIRFCTFTNQQNAMLVFRNGDNNVAYGNFFINAGGIRVKEANTIYCYNNYFENSGVGSSADAVTFIYDTTTYPVVLNNINFIHNTFYNCGAIDLGGTGATGNTWANNIFIKSSGSIFTNANSGTTWAGNIRSGTLGITIATGMTTDVNPLLELNADGYYGISSSSPAINTASASYPSILDIAGVDDDPTLAYDISRQSRPSLATSKDIGADEYTTGTRTNRPLAVTDVGPSFLGGPGSKLEQTITFNALPAKDVNNANFSAEATSSSNLTVSLASSDTAVATIVDGNIHIVGVGTTIITASQAGDLSYYAAVDVSQTFTVNKVNQTITFSALPAKVVGDADFNSGASASSNLTVSLASSNTAVATIVGRNIHIVGVGTADIIASQAGNDTYNIATDVVQELTVSGLTQTIMFTTLPLKYTNSPDFDPAAVSSDGSAITYTSSNQAVATIVNNKIHIVAKGTSNITASSNNGAAPITQQLIVQCSCMQN